MKLLLGVKNMTASFSNTQHTQKKNLLNVFPVCLLDKKKKSGHVAKNSICEWD